MRSHIGDRTRHVEIQFWNHMKRSPMTPQLAQHSVLIRTGGRYARKIKPPKLHRGSSPPTRPRGNVHSVCAAL